MSASDHAYVAPRAVRTTALPAAVVAYFDGTDLLAKVQAVRISTIDADGWPHASLLSAGDMLAMPSGHIRMVVFAASMTTANLTRDRRVTVTLVLDGAMQELRMACRRLAASFDERYAVFEAELSEAREHRAPYATLAGGVTFALREPQAVLQRWQAQIDALRRMK